MPSLSLSQPKTLDFLIHGQKKEIKCVYTIYAIVHVMISATVTLSQQFGCRSRRETPEQLE